MTTDAAMKMPPAVLRPPVATDAATRDAVSSDMATTDAATKTPAAVLRLPVVTDVALAAAKLAAAATMTAAKSLS
jgi:hypothetical protein